MKRTLVFAATAAIASMAWAVPASADDVQISAPDDAVCIAIKPVFGYCQGNPVPDVRGIIDRLTG